MTLSHKGYEKKRPYGHTWKHIKGNKKKKERKREREKATFNIETSRVHKRTRKEFFSSITKEYKSISSPEVLRNN